jgi:hypothetical protein
MFTKMTLANLGNYLNVAVSCNTTYADEFASKKVKIGDTYNIRKPQRFEVTSGLGYQPQPITNISTPVTVDQCKGVHFDFDQIEKTLSVEAINERYAKPAAIALASHVNQQVAQYIAQNAAFSVGTPGSTPTGVDTYLSARDRLIQLGLPQNSDINCILSTAMSSAFVNAQRTNFNPSALVSRQYDSGMVAGSALGMRWKLDETLYVHTVGTYGGTPAVLLAQSAEGGNNATMTLNTDGWSSGTSTLNKGDRFTIGSGTTGVYAVHPQTRQSTGVLQQFVVQNTISDTTGAMSPVIFPAITPSGQYQNVTQAAPNDALITVIGASGTVTRQAIVMHKDSFAFVPVPFELPPSGAGAIVANERDDETGIILTATQAFDAVNMRNIYRFDTLYGVSKLYAAEMACIVYAAQ